MFKVWCECKMMGLPTIINIFKDTEEDCKIYFDEYYANKYNLLNIVKYKNNKSA